MTAIMKPPQTETEKKQCKTALNKFFKEFDENKNNMARETGFSRNSIGWWFETGYIGSRAAVAIAKKMKRPLADLRPDIAIREERAAKAEAKPKPAPKPKPKAEAKPKPAPKAEAKPKKKPAARVKAKAKAKPAPETTEAAAQA